MTLLPESKRAVNSAEQFLLDLLDRSATPRVPKDIRERARRVLRHYPTATEVDRLFEPHENKPSL